MNKQATTVPLTSCGKEWAVILAGGNGTRLKSLTRQIAGDERPKQFCSVLGKKTLLDETRDRAAIELARQRTLYVVNHAHELYYRPLLGNALESNLVVQPSNRGTAPAILYSVLRIAAVDANAIVAFLPSDHYISDNKKFMTYVRAALETAKRQGDLVVLLGLEPESPEVEYGWIEPAEPIDSQSRIFKVRRFWEKPNQPLAQLLHLRGCLWNSFVMVASVQALLRAVASALPQLYDSFIDVSPFLSTPQEASRIEALYEGMTEVNFSHQVLAHRPEQLAVLKVTGIRWNDLGEPKRVMASLHMAGVRPHWAQDGMPQFA